MTAPDRRAMLAKVHIAAKALGLGGDAYGDVLTRVTGQDSARTLNNGQLHAVLAEFRRLGWSGAPIKRPSHKAQVRMIHGVWADLKPFLDSHGPEALRAFVRRQTRSTLHPQGVDAPEFLDAKQANLVLEGLKAWLTRKRAERRAAEASQLEDRT